MKYFINSALLIALLMSACTKQEVCQESNNEMISFKADISNEEPVTKASALSNAAFNVAAYYRPTSSSTEHSLYFASQKYSGDSDSFTSTPAHYWPIESGSVLDFYAAYVVGETDTPSVEAGESVEFTADGDRDFMAATLEKQSKGTDMTLPFEHKLTQLTFKVRGEIEGRYYVVTGVTVTANSKATYIWYSSTADECDTWATVSSATNLTYDFVPAEVSFTQSGTDYITEGFSTKYLVPSQLSEANSVSMAITYSIYSSSDRTSAIEVNKTVTTDLTESAASDWGMNKNVVYAITIKSEF